MQSRCWEMYVWIRLLWTLTLEKGKIQQRKLQLLKAMQYWSARCYISPVFIVSQCKPVKDVIWHCQCQESQLYYCDTILCKPEHHSVRDSNSCWPGWSNSCWPGWGTLSVVCLDDAGCIAEAPFMLSSVAGNWWDGCKDIKLLTMLFCLCCLINISITLYLVGELVPVH